MLRVCVFSSIVLYFWTVSLILEPEELWTGRNRLEMTAYRMYCVGPQAQCALNRSHTFRLSVWGNAFLFDHLGGKLSLSVPAKKFVMITQI